MDIEIVIDSTFSGTKLNLFSENLALYVNNV